MDLLLGISKNGAGIALACSLAPVALYSVLYLVFRLCGKLRVNARGWQAGGVYSGGRVVLPAFRVFALFQPLLRAESRLARWLGGLRRRKKRREPRVSEVVVELVPIA